MFKFDLKGISEEDFLVTPHTIGGDSCYFVRPRPTYFDWEDKTLENRSAIFNEAGQPVSLSYKKFFNLQEKPLIEPFDGELSGTSIIEKLDGSTLIVSRYNKDYIFRTRGTVDAGCMPNAAELQIFKDKYLYKLCQAESNSDTWVSTWIFEWCSPQNKIVIDYGDPRFVLTNRVFHHNYSLMEQGGLDTLGREWGFERPLRYQFETLSSLTKSVAANETFEGVCLYYNNDQSIRKIKSLWYLKLHAFKASCNLRTITDLYIDWGNPNSADFMVLVEKNFDFECASYAKPLIDLFYVGVVEKIRVAKIQSYAFYLTNKDLDQKQFAILANTELSIDNFSKPLAFKYKQGGELTDTKDTEIRAIRSFVETLRKTHKESEITINTE